MTEAKVPIFRTAVMSWRDGVAALRAMPTVAICTFVAMLFSQITADAVTIAIATEGFAWQWEFLRPGLALLDSFIAAPAGIAVSRYVLLGEAARRYDLDPSQPRLRRYFIYGAILDVLTASLIVSVESIAITADADRRASDFLFGLSASAFLLLVVVLSVFMLILFPAIATDAPGANFRNAVRDTHFWRALLAALLILLPVLIALVPSLLFYDLSEGFSLRWMSVVVYDAAITALALAAAAALGSHLYRAWGNRLRQPVAAEAAG